MFKDKDYYRILGVNKTASSQELQLAYRRLARKYHPDVSHEADAEEHFKAINEAYDVLSSPDKRQKYDKQARPAEPSKSSAPKRDHIDISFFEEISKRDLDDSHSGRGDFFESLFGKKARKKPSSTATDYDAKEPLESILTLSIEDIFFDSIKAIQTPHGETVQVRIPKGAEHGKRLRLAGKGGKGRDLMLTIQIEPHPYYRLEGKTLFLDLPIAPWEAALGASVMIPTPTGALSLKIPAGSQTGRKMRIPGRGVPSEEVQDMYVILHIQIPPAASEQQRKLYEQMQRDFNWQPRSHMRI